MATSRGHGSPRCARDDGIAWLRCPSWGWRSAFSLEWFTPWIGFSATRGDVRLAVLDLVAAVNSPIALTSWPLARQFDTLASARGK